MKQPADIHAIRAALAAVEALATEHGCSVQITFHAKGDMPAVFSALPTSDPVVTCHGKNHDIHTSADPYGGASWVRVLASTPIDDEDPRVVDLCHEHDQACHRWTRRRQGKAVSR